MREAGIDGWMDGWMEQREREARKRGGWMDRLMDGWMDMEIDGWMDGWIDQYGKMGAKIDR